MRSPALAVTETSVRSLRAEAPPSPMQVPEMAKHPAASVMPSLKVEVAEPVTSRAAVCIPPAKVLVPEPCTTSLSVVVASPTTVNPPVVMVELAVERNPTSKVMSPAAESAVSERRKLAPSMLSSVPVQSPVASSVRTPALFESPVPTRSVSTSPPKLSELEMCKFVVVALVVVAFVTVRVERDNEVVLTLIFASNSPCKSVWSDRVPVRLPHAGDPPVLSDSHPNFPLVHVSIFSVLQLARLEP